jgi:hypothetical protein
VDHHTDTVSAQFLCNALNNVAFGATITKDAGINSTVGNPTLVTSMLQIVDKDVRSERLEEMLQSFKASQVESFVVDMPNRVITITHNPLTLPITTMSDYLKEELSLQTIIISDGADNIEWEFPTLESSAGEKIEDGEATPWPKTTVLISGFCWLVSMLSLVVHKL